MASPYAELLIGCGFNQRKQIWLPGHQEWAARVTLDINPDCRPDVEWDLNRLPLPFADDSFDEIHAYHVLEHVGRQGDWRFFFDQFSDLWRILRPDGYLVVKLPKGQWTWADPGHTRAFGEQQFMFLM